MVRVLECHHFSAQDVFRSEFEPMATYTSDRWLFLATSHCYVEVYDITKPGCPLVHRFPSVAQVKQIQYSKKDNFLATLEQKDYKNHHQTFIRVYLNWQADLSEEPMRVRVAGQSTSIRQEQATDTGDRFEVVEIPLKYDDPRCIAVDGSTGNLAIGVSTTILVYGLCCKTAVSTDQQYEDMRCLLELEFSFTVRRIALCEELIVCCSSSKLQVVKLNVKNLPAVNSAVLSKSKDRLYQSDKSDSDKNTESDFSDGIPSQSDQEKVVRRKESALETSTSDYEIIETPINIEKTLPYKPLYVNIERLKKDDKSDSLSGRTLSNQDSRSSQTLRSKDTTTTAQEGYQVEDEHHVEFYMGEMSAHMREQATKKRTGDHAPGVGNIWLGTVSRAIREQQQRQQRATGHHREVEDVEHRGPFERHDQCPVEVQYEGICCCETKKENLVERGVLTCLYREFKNEVTNLGNLQLIPVYVSTDGDSSDSSEACCSGGDTSDTYISPRRSQLLGVTCFFSCSRQGYLYSVYDHVRRLAVYPYTAELVQAHMDSHLLYAATAAGLEVYTARTNAFVMHETYGYDHITNTLPSYKLDVCLISLKPFIAAFSLGMSSGKVILVSKFTERVSGNDICDWSVYALSRPTSKQLLSDMQELTQHYQNASVHVYLHLLQEMLLLAQGTRWETSPQQEELCMSLAEVHARTDSIHPQFTVPYLYMTHASCAHIIRTLTSKLGSRQPGQDNSNSSSSSSSNANLHVGPGLWLFLEHLLQDRDKTAALSVEDGDAILKLYAEMKPSELAGLIVNANLEAFTPHTAQDYLQAWLQSPERSASVSSGSKLDVLAAALLYLQTGDLGDAEAVLFSLPESELIQLCIENHQVLHKNFSVFSPLAQMMRRWRPEVFLSVLVGLHDNGSMVMETVIEIFNNECSSDVSSSQSHLLEYLEKLLSHTSRHYIFNDAGTMAISIYLSRLFRPNVQHQDPAALLQDVQEKILKGQGHYAERYTWLNQLPPFEGSLKKSCLLYPLNRKHLGGLSSSQSSSSPPLLTSKTAQNNAGSGPCNCMLCHSVLLKLQSLLCSRYITKQHCQLILDKLMRSHDQSHDQSNGQSNDPQSHDHQSHDLLGISSLQLLCESKLSPKSGIERVVNDYPSILASYMKDILTDELELSGFLVELLLTKVEELERERNDDAYGVYKSSLCDVLTLLAESMSPPQLLTLLPEEGNMAYFSQYLERSVNKQQAQELRSTILSK